MLLYKSNKISNVKFNNLMIKYITVYKHFSTLNSVRNIFAGY